VRRATIAFVSSVASSADLSAQPIAAGGGKALAGFLLSGFLLSLLGAILPAWGYHRDPPDFVAVGSYFFTLAAGIVVAAAVSRSLLARSSIRFLLTSSCALAVAALAYLALVPPPAADWWRAGGLFALGIGAGLLNPALFHAISGTYQADASGALNKGGLWYGVGCVAATLLVAAYTAPRILLFMAAVPAIFGAVYARERFAEPPRSAHPGMRQALHDFRSPGAVLFALLLFVQFGNEWSIAGWLPLFLIRRVGLSITAGLLTLALYWLFLMSGRLAAVAILPRVRHGRLLLGSVAAALFGCLILFSTKTGFGAVSGVFFLGAGYASVYPLVAEAIGRRFPYYHPGFFNGIFSLALLGGLLAPATLGYAAGQWGVGVVVGIPLLGSCMVMVLLALLWLESKVTGR
jgi:FHS family glucose/mannose:H+ symporter-like MFS transporter